ARHAGPRPAIEPRELRSVVGSRRAKGVERVQALDRAEMPAAGPAVRNHGLEWIGPGADLVASDGRAGRREQRGQRRLADRTWHGRRYRLRQHREYHEDR